MNVLKKIWFCLLAILLVLVLPTAMTWGGWWLVGSLPDAVRGSIMMLVPYGLAVAVWCCLAWICGNIFVAIID